MAAKSKTPQRFVVRGTGRFPIDMLRYDACWPASSEDARKITESITDPATGLDGMLTIALAIAPGYSEPTIARWQSFGWFVQDH